MSEHIRETDMPDDEELILLRRRLDNHIDEYRLYVLEASKRDEKLAENIEALVASTQGLVDSWKVTQAIRKFVVWVSVFTVPATAVYTKLKGMW